MGNVAVGRGARGGAVADRRALLAISLAAALWLGAALVLRVGPAASGGAAANVPGTIRVIPAESHLQAGQTVTVEVWLDGGGNYYGLDVRLSFDPAVVRVPSGRVTPLWDVLDPVDHFAIKNVADNVNGTVWYALTNINPAEAFTGTGRICAIAFTGVASGTSPLHWTYAKGSTRNGDGLYPALVDALVSVDAPERYRVLVPLVLRDGPTF
ncbi:MAG TPA: cohesin domain-containing protein [Anaerolineae bacterium]|nr:cohesin domain-containing protein [Anaerolineae bacterium]HNT06508.1 cohesin domain-containing protein [Anaerolineae bacterium]